MAMCPQFRKLTEEAAVKRPAHKLNEQLRVEEQSNRYKKKILEKLRAHSLNRNL